MAVPDTNTFTLQDVRDEVYGTIFTGQNLYDMFDDANPDYFNSSYTPSGFDPSAIDKSGFEMYYFRDYGEHNSYSLTLSPISMAFGAGGGEQNLTIDVEPAGTNWELFSKPDWVILSQTSGSGDTIILITAQPNPNTTPRSGTVTIKLSNYEVYADCQVDQDGQ